MREERAPGRPRSFDLDETLDVVMDLFWDRGYEAVSLSDIVAATGLRKGSLYAAYGDKRAMYLKSLARYDAQQVERTVAALMAPGDARARIAAFLDAPIAAAGEDGDSRGCFLCNASADQAAADPEAAALVRRGFDRMARALAAAAADLGLSVTPEAAKAVAAECLAAFSGMRVMARTGIALPMMEAARDRVMAGLPGTA